MNGKYPNKEKEETKKCMLYYPFDNKEEEAEARQDARQELQYEMKRKMENKKRKKPYQRKLNQEKTSNIFSGHLGTA